MPRDATATLDDGTQVLYKAIPDGVTPDQFSARVIKDNPGRTVTAIDGGTQQAPGLGKLGDHLLEIGKAAGRGVIGLANLVGMGGTPGADATDSPEIMMAGGGGAAAGAGVGPTADPSKVLPRGNIDPREAALFEGMAGAAPFTGFGAPVRMLAGGALGGLGSELGKENFPTSGFIGPLIGSLLGGGVGAAGALRTNAPQAAAKALQGVDPADLATAVRNQVAARSAGVPINLSQAMEVPSNIDPMVAKVASSVKGTQSQDLLRDQPGLLKVLMDRITGGMPGHAVNPQAAANDAEAGATAYIKDARTTSGQLAAVPPGTAVPQGNLNAFSQALDAYAAAHPNTAAAGMAQAVKAKLFGAPIPGTPGTPAAPLGSGPVSSGIMVPGTPATPPTPQSLSDVAQLKGAVDDAIQNFGSTPLSANPGQKDLNRFAQDIRGLRDATLFPVGSPERNARTLSAASFGQTVDPAEKSVIGRVAGQTGTEADKEASVSRLMSVFDKGTPVDPSTGRGIADSDILTLQRAQAAQDPAVFTNAAKTWLAGKLSGLKLDASGRVPEDFAQQITSTFGSTPAAQAGLMDVLTGMERSAGLPAGSLSNDFQGLLKIAAQASKGPRASLGAQGAADALTNSNTATGLKILPYLWRVSTALQSVLSRNAAAKLDALFTNPDNVAALQALAARGGTSPQAVNAFGTTMGGLATQIGN